MEADTTNCHGLRCFICGGPGTEMQKLSKVTHKGYQQLLSYSEIVDDAMLINSLHEDWKDGDDPKLKYHLDCRNELYHRSRSVSIANRSGQHALDQRSYRMKRRNVLSGPSTSSAGSSTAQTPSAHLVYLDVCILCNEGINSVMLEKYPEAGCCIVHLTIDEQRIQCCGIQIHPDLKSIVPREKFLDNKNNKAQLILLC
ncbi:unnamed protein product [Arctogadus glacialis]